MKIIITGSVGAGKTTLSKQLSQKLNIPVINELAFAKKHKIGQTKQNEYLIPLTKLKKILTIKLKNSKKVIIEGHLLCEINLPADICILLKTTPKTLEKRLSKRNYSETKIQDNIFCAQTGHFKKNALKNYKQIIEISTATSPKRTLEKALLHINKIKRVI
jgi:adenylate kinase